MDKNERKKILRALKEKQKAKFEESLPMSCDLFHELFDFLDEKLVVEGCSHTVKMTVLFLNQRDISTNPVLTWLEEQGGYCDCEILGNGQNAFE